MNATRRYVYAKLTGRTEREALGAAGWLDRPTEAAKRLLEAAYRVKRSGYTTALLRRREKHLVAMLEDVRRMKRAAKLVELVEQWAHLRPIPPTPEDP